jgi:diguanylate cyclase
LAAIASVPSSAWFVVARITTSELFAPITRLRHFILITTAILVPIFLIIMGLGLRYQLRLLRRAAQHAERMTRGEIPLAPLPLIHQDELGHLTAAFNGVLDRLLASRAELEHRAHHDGLTGLPNRRLLADRVQQAIARARRGEQQVALLYLDLDGFKAINDRWGHSAGDAALCEVAERLGSLLRCEDTLARVGGDEFVILVTDVHGQVKSAVEAVANKCLDVFTENFLIHGQWYRLGASLGIAIGRGECALDELLRAADAAMYRAKEAGGGRFAWARD